jgi:hypothetical protein
MPGCREILGRDVSGFSCDVRSAECLAAALGRFVALPHGARIVMEKAGRAMMGEASQSHRGQCLLHDHRNRNNASGFSPRQPDATKPNSCPVVYVVTFERYIHISNGIWTAAGSAASEGYTPW